MGKALLVLTPLARVHALRLAIVEGLGVQDVRQLGCPHRRRGHHEGGRNLIVLDCWPLLGSDQLLVGDSVEGGLLDLGPRREALALLRCVGDWCDGLWLLGQGCLADDFLVEQVSVAPLEAAVRRLVLNLLGDSLG